jgi:hypothetical protein
MRPNPAFEPTAHGKPWAVVSTRTLDLALPLNVNENVRLRKYERSLERQSSPEP